MRDRNEGNGFVVRPSSRGYQEISRIWEQCRKLYVYGKSMCLYDIFYHVHTKH